MALKSQHVRSVRAASLPALAAHRLRAILALGDDGVGLLLRPGGQVARGRAGLGQRVQQLLRPAVAGADHAAGRRCGGVDDGHGERRDASRADACLHVGAEFVAGQCAAGTRLQQDEGGGSGDGGVQSHGGGFCRLPGPRWRLRDEGVQRGSDLTLSLRCVWPACA